MEFLHQAQKNNNNDKKNPLRKNILVFQEMELPSPLKH